MDWLQTRSVAKGELAVLVVLSAVGVAALIFGIVWTVLDIAQDREVVRLAPGECKTVEADWFHGYQEVTICVR